MSTLKQIMPDYYTEFQCIADRCRHNCCIGWEIDIDEDTLDYYRSIPGAFGQRLKNGIQNVQPPCFRLDKQGRCVFLNKNGLCDIITTLGETALCDICTDHPRFRNFFSDRTEIGLGLCCEEACRLILGKPDPVRLIESGACGENPTSAEAVFLTRRAAIFHLLQNRTLSFAARLQQVADQYGTHPELATPFEWSKRYHALERMDPVWDRYLELLAQAPAYDCSVGFDTVWEQLAIYLVYRHLTAALEDGQFIPRLSFCIHAAQIIQTICALISADFAQICEIVRLYSCEIEYSDENVDRLLEFLH